MLHSTFALAKAAGSGDDDFAKVHAALGIDYFAKVFDALGGDAYGWDTPFPLDKVLEVAGLTAALWALRYVLPGEEADRDRIARLFAADAAETVLHIFERERPGDTRPREAIVVARRFARGEATDRERDTAWVTAQAATEDTAWAAAEAAARAAAWTSAEAAARASARAAVRASVKTAAGAAVKTVATENLAQLLRTHLDSEVFETAGDTNDGRS